MSLDLAHLNRTRVVKGREEPSVAPCLAVVLYSELTLQDLAPALGETMEMYLRFIPPDTLRSCWAGEGMKKLTPQKLKRDLKTLASMPEHQEEFYLRYSEGEYGPPAAHGILVFADKFEAGAATETNLLRLELPGASAEGERLEALLDFVKAVAKAFPFSVGNVGFGFSYPLFNGRIRSQVNALLVRYLGFDASSIHCRHWMRGRTSPAHWINLLGERALGQLGGLKALKAAISGVEAVAVNGGVLVRAAKRPPVADVNVGAPDVGLLPDLARCLQPTRFQMRALRWADETEVDRWLGRFDSLASSNWDNR